ncbi:MAG: zf-HC2 domain-containing protein [Opitutaceae bacterium]|jgi:anti-sigma factor RsiW
MICEQAKDLISSHLDDTLPEEQSAALRSHLDACPACRLELRQLSRTLELIDSMPADEPSPRLRNHFNAMLRAEILAEEERKSSSSGLRARLERFWSAMAPRPALQFASLSRSC